MASGVAAYRGRRVDLAAFRGLAAAAPGLAGARPLAHQLVRPGDGGRLVAGVEKLAQRVLLVLLTRRGSRRYAPAEGTAFMADAASGRWRTVADVTASFYSARLDVVRQCRAAESADDPPDERLRGLDLEGVVLSGDKVTLRLRLTTEAGSGYTFLTPIAVPLR